MVENPNINNSNQVLNASSPNGLNANPLSFKAGRVVNIVLDSSNEKFEEAGEWNGLGTIYYQDLTNPNNTLTLPAKPYLGNIKNYPLINEIVWIVTFPNTQLNPIGNTKAFTTAVGDYYITPISIWNHPHHNAFPRNPNTLPISQQKDYIQTQIGNITKITNQSTEINLGKTFKERSNIHPLLPFEGDIINEGRWGNSIRIGSTVKRKVLGVINDALNPWSGTPSNSGDPIVIIRNGQGEQSKEGWLPTIEDINNDDSSIYLTSTQKIPLIASSTNYFSYKKNIPEAPNEYAGKQIILNSGRLVFNSSTDHILLSSNKSINLNSVEKINFDTPVFTVQSQNIYLGSKSAKEPLLLGNQTVNLLNQLISNLASFAQICSTLVSTPPGVPIAPLNIASTQLIDSLEALQANLNDLKSKYNYTV